jgi:leucyl-tRNA---protein transferase
VERTLTFTTPHARCEYLPDRVSRLRYELVPDVAPDDYMDRLRHGWRRFGYAIFRPECAACNMCRSLRVPTHTFQASSSQRRVWKKNQGVVAVRIGAPAVSRARIELWRKFHQHGVEAKGWPQQTADDPGMLLQNPFPIEEWTYHVDDKLVGVGYVDVLPQGLSAIYFYWHPEEQARSLGTFNVLSLIASARERQLPHVYLGYYVEGCRSLEYKASFRPNELLVGGKWRGE